MGRNLHLVISFENQHSEKCQVTIKEKELKIKPGEERNTNLNLHTYTIKDPMY